MHKHKKHLAEKIVPHHPCFVVIGSQAIVCSEDQTKKEFFTQMSKALLLESQIGRLIGNFQKCTCLPSQSAWAMMSNQSAKLKHNTKKFEKNRHPRCLFNLLSVIFKQINKLKIWAGAVVQWFWDKTNVHRVVGSNPSTLYWMDVFKLICYKQL